LANGTVLIHAHPYDKARDNTPIKHHHHSTADYFLIQHFHLLFFISFLTFTALAFRLFVEQNPIYYFRKRQPFHRAQSGRSPPFIG